MFAYESTVCPLPRRPYSAADLPAEYHPAVLDRFTRAAYRDLMREALAPAPGKERIRTRQQRDGIRERAEEAGAFAYARWLALRGVDWCAAGDHARAINGTVRYMRRSGWRGQTGQRREAYRKATAERLAWEARRREALQDRPAAVAEARERVSGSPHLSRKAYRLAARAGLPGGVPALLTLATLAEVTERGNYTPAPAPAPMAGLHREGLTTARPAPAPATVTPADALHALRRLGRGVTGRDARREVAAAIRRHRAAVRG